MISSALSALCLRLPAYCWCLYCIAQSGNRGKEFAIKIYWRSLSVFGVGNDVCVCVV